MFNNIYNYLEYQIDDFNFVYNYASDGKTGVLSTCFRENIPWVHLLKLNFLRNSV